MFLSLLELFLLKLSCSCIMMHAALASNMLSDCHSVACYVEFVRRGVGIVKSCKQSHDVPYMLPCRPNRSIPMHW